MPPCHIGAASVPSQFVSARQLPSSRSQSQMSEALPPRYRFQPPTQFGISGVYASHPPSALIAASAPYGTGSGSGHPPAAATVYRSVRPSRPLRGAV